MGARRKNLCSNHRFTCFVVMMMNVSKSYVVLIVLWTWACRHNSESHTPKHKSKMKFHAQVTFASVVVVYSIHSTTHSCSLNSTFSIISLEENGSFYHWAAWWKKFSWNNIELIFIAQIVLSKRKTIEKMKKILIWRIYECVTIHSVIHLQ